MHLVWQFGQGAQDNEGLHVIQDQDGLHSMWIDVDAANAKEVSVFMQDVESEICPHNQTLLYAIPLEVRVPVGHFNSKATNHQVKIWQKMVHC